MKLDTRQFCRCFDVWKSGDLKICCKKFANLFDIPEEVGEIWITIRSRSTDSTMRMVVSYNYRGLLTLRAENGRCWSHGNIYASMRGYLKLQFPSRKVFYIEVEYLAERNERGRDE